jgi:TetR/AcrR family transcriptional regulator, transcriptional repressor for nem operon
MANNKDRLIEAGADLFHRKGYASTSLDDILALTGVARSNFYYHFKSKIALAREVAAHWVDRYDKAIVEPSLGRLDASPIVRLKRLFALAAASQNPVEGRTGCPLGRLSTDLAAADSEIREQIESYFKVLRGRLTSLTREIRPKDAPPQEAEELAEVALCILEGGLLLSNLRRSGAEIPVAGQAFLDLLNCGSGRARRRPQGAVDGFLAYS